MNSEANAKWAREFLAKAEDLAADRQDFASILYPGLRLKMEELSNRGLCQECYELPEDSPRSLSNDCICEWHQIRHYLATFRIFDKAMKEIEKLGGPAAEIADRAREEARSNKE